MVSCMEFFYHICVNFSQVAINNDMLKSNVLLQFLVNTILVICYVLSDGAKWPTFHPQCTKVCLSLLKIWWCLCLWHQRKQSSLDFLSHHQHIFWLSVHQSEVNSTAANMLLTSQLSQVIFSYSFVPFCSASVY